MPPGAESYQSMDINDQRFKQAFQFSPWKAIENVLVLQACPPRLIETAPDQFQLACAVRVG